MSAPHGGVVILLRKIYFGRAIVGDEQIHFKLVAIDFS